MTRPAPINARDDANASGWQFGLFDLLAMSAAAPPLLAMLWTNYRDVSQRLDVDNMIWYFQRWPMVFLIALIIALAIKIRGVRLIAILGCAVAAIATLVNLCLVVNDLNHI